MKNGKDNKKGTSDAVSAKDLLAKLHANMSGDAAASDAADFNERIAETSSVGSDIYSEQGVEDFDPINFDADELMKKYLSEEDYERFAHGSIADEAETEYADGEDELSHTEPLADTSDADFEPQLDELPDDIFEDEPVDESADDISDELPDEADGIYADEDELTELDDISDDTALEGEGMLDSDEREELDDMDVNLMIAFGMEDELQEALGEDNMGEIEARIEKNTENCDPDALDEEGDDIPPEYEYTSNVQSKDIFRKFTKKYHSLIIRLLLSFLIMAVVFVYDNSSMLGITLPTKINMQVYPVVHIMVGLQFVMLSGLLVLDELRDGFFALIKFKPIPESVTVLMFAIGIIYSIVMCFAPVGQNILLFGLPVTMCVFFTLLYEFLNLKRIILTFNVVSSKKLKYAITECSKDENAKQEIEAFSEYLPEDPSVFRINKTAFIDGFFRRTRIQSQNKVALNTIFPLALAIAVISAVVSLIRVDNGFSAASYGFMALLLAMPVSAFVTYSYPFYRASRIAYKKGSAIVGEGALDEYSSASVITFDDRDVFPAQGVKMKSVKVYDNHRIDRVIYNASSVFHVMGGPLADVFDVVTRDIGYSDSVEILNTDGDGIEAMIGDVNVHVGKAEYLRRLGFAPDDEDTELDADPTVNIIYMVEDGDLSAKIYMQYRIDPDFEYNLKVLYKAGICVGIKTCDPTIDDEMLGRYIALDKYPVKVLKLENAGDETYMRKERIDSGIVSKSSPKALLQTIALCDRIQHATKTGVIIKLFASIIPIGIVAFLLFNQLFEFSSFYVALYQLFWMIPIAITSRMSV